MPLPYKKVRYRYKTISPRKRIRLAFVGKKKVVETTTYTKRNGWKKGKTIVRGSKRRRGTTRRLG